MNTQDKIIQISQEIAAKQQRAAELQTELERSLMIKAIWPEAFDDGQPVYSGGKKRMLPGWRREIGFTEFYFRKESGVKRYLTRDELLAFIPDAIIHPEYQTY